MIKVSNEKKVLFHFYDENTKIDHRIPVSCTETEWNEWVEEDYEKADSFIAGLETDLPVVHDADDWNQPDGTILLGFQSYEAKSKGMINQVLIKWKEKLVELGWTSEDNSFTQIKWNK